MDMSQICGLPRVSTLKKIPAVERRAADVLCVNRRWQSGRGPRCATISSRTPRGDPLRIVAAVHQQPWKLRGEYLVRSPSVQDERVAKGIIDDGESANRDLSRLEDHPSARLDDGSSCVGTSSGARTAKA